MAGQMGHPIGQMASMHDIADFYLKWYKNYTRCDTWQEIELSHTKASDKKVITLDDTYGLILLLSVGLAIAAITVFVEKMRKLCVKCNPIFFGLLYRAVE